jgi:phage gp46-like protein
MTDFRTAILPTGIGQLPRFDCLIDAPGLAAEFGLETAVIISLFTDRRAEPGDTIPDGTDNRRGWWGDAFPDADGDLIGSRLWLLNREMQLQSVVNLAREYALEALLWLVDDGVARRVEVDAEIVRTGVLGLDVRIYRASGAAAQYRFSLFWANGAPEEIPGPVMPVVLSGAAQAQASASGTTSVSTGLAGSAAAQASAVGAVSVATWLEGAAQAQASAADSGLIDVDAEFAGAAQAQASGTGDVDVDTGLAGAAQASASAAGDADVDTGLEGSAQAQASGAGDLDVTP